MGVTEVGFPTRYASAFADYLSTRGEDALEAAYELGREAFADRLSLLDLADAHHRAMAASAGDAQGDLTEAAGVFFRESLAAFEIAQRGFHEAQEMVRLEQAHAAQQQSLAEASIEVNETLSPQQILDVVVARACEIVGGAAARAEVLLEDSPLVATKGAFDAAPEHGEVAAPLTARGRRDLGALRVRAVNARQAAMAQSILVQLAQVASVAIENARRYQREREIAQTLQRSLLPPRLPDIDFLEVAARYRPALDGIQVGGDFYDVFRAGSGQWMAVIGDVCGKGPEAASLTALTRYTLRAAALHERSPAAVLELLNAAMIESRTDGRFATVLCAQLAPQAGTLSTLVSSGGHPLPIVVRADGTIETVGAAGTLLGVVPMPALSDAAARLGPGDTVLMYTDGVTEVRLDGREVFGFNHLLQLVRENVGIDPEALLDKIERSVLEASGGSPRDDVALLALRVRA